MGGEFEAPAVEACLCAAGVEVENRSQTDLTPAKFSELYCSADYDLFWINAHGEFNATDPHRAYLQLSADREQAISLAELVQLPVPRVGRRLLFLNICDGGNVLVTDAPPRLGIAPMLASAHQAVISHLWPVRQFVAAAFGVFMADALRGNRPFFDAFVVALGRIRGDRDEIVQRLAACQPRPDDLIDRIANGPDDLTPSSILNWGSPVWYE